MPSIDIIIDLSPAQCEAHYAGAVRQVYVSSVDGRRVLLPAQALRQVIARDGVHGVFRLAYTRAGKFESMQPIERWPGA